jgi:hypothetical protein
MMKNALIAVLLATAAMAQVPYSVKHDQLGESLASYQMNNSDCPKTAFKAEETSGVSVCASSDKTLTYAGVQLTTKRITALHDQVVMINLTFSHAQYNSVLAALRESFGEGTMSVTERSVLITLVEVMLGKETTQRQKETVPPSAENFKWSNGVSTIQLSEYDASDPTFQTSNVTFSLDSALKEIRNNFDRYVERHSGNLRSAM